MNSKRLENMFFRLIVIFCVVFSSFFTATVNSETTEPPGLEQEIRDLVRKLGDDSFIVRQRSESRLLRIGIDAFHELKQALNDEDVEIARRAAQLLSQFEIAFLAQESGAVRYFVNMYAVEPNIAQRVVYLRVLANPSEFPGGEGLKTLCRIVRFDTQRTLRVEATKCLIALAPFAPLQQEKWFRFLVKFFSESDSDELFRLISQYARLRCDILDLQNAAELRARQREQDENVPIDYPVSISIDAELQNRVQIFVDLLAAFQSDPKNNEIQPGSWVDMLLYYAAAELLDDVGLTAERDKTLETVRAVRTEAVRTDNPLLPIDQHSHHQLVDHYYTAGVLLGRNRFHWTLPHFSLVIDGGEPSLKTKACAHAASVMQMLKDHSGAIRFLERKLEIVASKDYTDRYSDGEALGKEANAAKSYFLALMAYEADDLSKAVELVDQGLEFDPHEVDTIILRHKIGKRLPDLGTKYREKTKQLIDGAIRNIEHDMHRRGMRPQLVCNQIAWLLANTDGDYTTASELIGVTMKLEPDSPAYLDTQAHVYAIGKEYDKAIESQEKALKIAPEAVVFRDTLERLRKERTENAKK